LLITASVALIAVVLALLLYDIEPNYSGRTLAEWIKASSQTPPDPEATNAIIRITTYSAPVLVRWVLADASPRFGLINKLPLRWYPIVTRNPLLRPLLYRDNEMFHAACAMRAFEIAGTNAAPAVPAVEAMITDYNFQVATEAIHLLSVIGPPALPAIRRAMGHRSPFIRLQAVGALRCCGTNAVEAIPDVLKALSDWDINVRVNASNVLETLCPAALTNPPAQ
jgi:hypothetical protein